MTTDRKTPRIRRVLVALDTSPGSLAAAGTAARLAALLEAELAGLFVEDADLLHLSRSPMAEQIDLLTAAFDRVESQELERQLQDQAHRAQRVLERMAEDQGLEWSFQIARGAVTEEICSATGQTDLVSLGRVGWSLRHRHRLGRTARALLAEPGRCTLLTKRPSHIRSPLAVVFNDSTAAGDAVEIALSLAGGDADSLTVLLLGRDLRGLRDRLRDQLGEAGTPPSIVELGDRVDSRLCRTIRRIGAGLLVLPVGGDDLGEEQVQDLLNDLDCPILAVS